MKTFYFLLIIICFALLEVAMLPYARVFGVKPDLLLLSVVLASLFFERRPALIVSLAAGILKDIFGISSFGLNTLLFPLWCMVIGRLSRKISFEQPLFSAMLMFLVTLANGVITRLIFLFSGNVIYLFAFLRVSFIESLYTALLFPLASRLTRPVLLMEEPEKEDIKEEEI